MAVQALSALGLLAWFTTLALANTSPETHNYLEKFQAQNLLSALGGAAQLAVNNTKLRADEEWVEVSVTGVQQPNATDYIAVFSPPGSWKRQAAPVKYESLAAADGYLDSGSGSLILRLVNLQADMQFALIRGGLEAPSVAAEGPVILNEVPNDPTGIHLMLGHKPWEMLVQWTTRDAGSPVVTYGTEPGHRIFAAPATTDTYTRGQMCGAPANREGWMDPGSIHTAAMTGLLPGQRYYYSVGDLATGVFSPERSFVAHPGVGRHLQVHMLGVADQGVGEPDGSTAAMEFQPALQVGRMMIQDVLNGYSDSDGATDAELPRYTLALHNGDISYARGYGALWGTFLHQQAPLLERIPFMTAMGNHERDWPGSGDVYNSSWDSGGECGVAYEKRFPMPNTRPGSPWYSFAYGPVHFTVMSTEHEFTAGSQQYHWLAADFGSVDRAATPWLVLVGHRPIYINAADFAPGGKQITAIMLQTALEDLLHEHSVDLAFAGHHHSYQRTCPVYRKQCRYDEHGAPAGAVHVVFGHGGADLYNDGFPERPAWAAAEDRATHGHIRMHVNGTTFHLEAVRSTDGSVFDELLLFKPLTEGPSESPTSDEALSYA